MGQLMNKVNFNDRARWIESAQNSDFHISRLASDLGLSRRQIERYIKRLFALTPQQWMRQLRMSKAAQLVTVVHSVKEIAYLLGFPQVSSFCRQFKSHYGMTCTEYASAIALAQRKPATEHAVVLMMPPMAPGIVATHQTPDGGEPSSVGSNRRIAT